MGLLGHGSILYEGALYNNNVYIGDEGFISVPFGSVCY